MVAQISDYAVIKRRIQVHIASAAVVIANLLDQIDQLRTTGERFVRDVDIHVWDAAKDRALEHSDPQLVEIAKIDMF